MNVKERPGSVFVIGDLFEDIELNDISNEIFGPYHSTMTKRERSADKVGPRWLGLRKPYEGGLGDNPLLLSKIPKIEYAIKKILKPPFDIECARINTNIQFKHQDTTFHTDGYIDEIDNDLVKWWSWTFVLFPGYEWSPEWGGQFCYQDLNNDYHYVPCIPGTGVLFNGWYPHKGDPPNSFSKEIRLSAAWTFCTRDVTASWTYPL